MKEMFIRHITEDAAERIRLVELRMQSSIRSWRFFSYANFCFAWSWIVSEFIAHNDVLNAGFDAFGAATQIGITLTYRHLVKREMDSWLAFRQAVLTDRDAHIAALHAADFE